MSRFVVVLVFVLSGLAFSSRVGAVETRIRILARVGETSISNREILLEWLLKNPKSYVPGRRDYYGPETEKQLLQEFVVQVLVEEENRLVGSQTLSTALLERKVLETQRAFGSRWKSFRNDFSVSETEVKTRLSRSLLAQQTIETRLKDALQGSKGESDAAALKKAEDTLQTWLQQLRSRYKVQMFRYEDAPKP
jgi:hypothetical protein